MFLQPITLDATPQLYFGMCVILIIVFYRKLGVQADRQRVLLIFSLRDYPVKLYNQFERIKVNWIFTCFLLLNRLPLFLHKHKIIFVLKFINAIRYFMPQRGLQNLRRVICFIVCAGKFYYYLFNVVRHINQYQIHSKQLIMYKAKHLTEN